VPTLFKLLPLIFTVSLSALAIILSEFSPKSLISFKFSRLGYNIFGFFNQRFFIELLYNKYITGMVFKFGGQTTQVIDKGSVELLGPYGLENSLTILSKNIASLDKGVITSYALYILIGFIFYLLTPSLTLFSHSLLLLIIIALLSIINVKDYSNSNLVDQNSNSNLVDNNSDSKNENIILESSMFSFKGFFNSFNNLNIDLFLLYILNLFDLSLNPVSSFILDNRDNDEDLSSSIVQASKATPEELAEKIEEKKVTESALERETLERKKINDAQSKAGDDSDDDLEQELTDKLVAKDHVIGLIQKSKDLLEEWFKS